MSLQAACKTPIQSDVSLRSYSTLKIGGNARFLAEPLTRDELLEALRFQRREGLKLLVVGRGSNILFADDGFSGLVLSLRKLECEQILVEGSEHVRASSGASLFRLAAFTQIHGLTGVEFLCHIPGTVGGAVAMNAGFSRPGERWHEIKDILESVTVLDLKTHQVQNLKQDELIFEYRNTHLPAHSIVLDALFHLTPSASELVEEQIKANFAYRNSVQDLRYPSAGSVFKNPRNSAFSSGKLLDQAGMKGVRVGGAMVSERHANFFLNVDNATAGDILELIQIGRKRVEEQFGIHLELELKYVGDGGEERIQNGI